MGSLLVALAVTVACRGEAPTATPDGTSSAAKPQADAPLAPEPLDPLSLRVPLDQLSRIEIIRNGAGVPEAERHIVLERDLTKGAGLKPGQGQGESEWTVVSPIRYPANQSAMEPIAAVLGEIRITTSAPGDEESARKHGLDEHSGIEVKAWTGDRLATHVIVGRSTREETYVKRAGDGSDGRILTVQGRCRRIFDRPLDELRHPVVTDFDVKEIAGVRYSSPSGRLEFVADPARPGHFLNKGASIRNFDADRASQNVSVLAHLFARGFVDASADRKQTGLFDDDTPKATVLFRKGPPVHVWVGAPTAKGRLLPVRTSDGDQIYLVSSHLDSSLVPQKSHLERTDAHMREIRALQKKLAQDEAEHAAKGKAEHAHGLPTEPASQVPPELMKELRDLAAEQQKRP